MSLYFKSFLLVFFMFASASATAGSRGYNVLWINLISPDHAVTNEIRAYVKNPPNINNCLLINSDIGGNLYSRTRPHGLTDTLVNKALSGDKKSELKLKKILHNFEDDRVSGFDGIFIYREDQRSRYLTVVSPGNDNPKTFIQSKKNPLTKYLLRDMICGAISPLERNFSP